MSATRAVVEVPPCADPATTTLKIEITGSDPADVLAMLTKVRRKVRAGCPFGRLATDIGTGSFSVETR